MNAPIATTPEELRKACPGTRKWVYLDVAARGLISASVKAAAEGDLEQRMMDGGDKAWMFERVESARTLLARLINATPDEIALTRNVSDGINAIANAIPWKPGDNVVICEALEHPANLFPWLALAKRYGIGIKSVKSVNGALPLEDVISAIDGQTRVVTLSSVSFSPGFAFPVGVIGEHCRQRDVLTVIDAAQSIGIANIDVGRLKIDALAASTQKGLMALYGLGFLYVRADLAGQLTPVYVSRMSLADAGGHEASSGDQADFRLGPAARRFDVGNYNYIGVVALERSLQDLLSIGAARIEVHAQALAARLSRGLADAGFPVFQPLDEAGRSHIVAVGRELSDDHDQTRDSEMIRFYKHLEDNDVRLTIRRGMLRFSIHAYNDTSDIDRVLDLARRF